MEKFDFQNLGSDFFRDISDFYNGVSNIGRDSLSKTAKIIYLRISKILGFRLRKWKKSNHSNFFLFNVFCSGFFYSNGTIFLSLETPNPARFREIHFCRFSSYSVRTAWHLNHWITSFLPRSCFFLPRLRPETCFLWHWRVLLPVVQRSD